MRLVSPHPITNHFSVCGFWPTGTLNAERGSRGRAAIPHPQRAPSRLGHGRCAVNGGSDEDGEAGYSGGRGHYSHGDGGIHSTGKEGWHRGSESLTPSADRADLQPGSGAVHGFEASGAKRVSAVGGHRGIEVVQAHGAAAVERRPFSNSRLVGVVVVAAAADLSHNAGAVRVDAGASRHRLRERPDSDEGQSSSGEHPSSDEGEENQDLRNTQAIPKSCKSCQTVGGGPQANPVWDTSIFDPGALIFGVFFFFFPLYNRSGQWGERNAGGRVRILTMSSNPSSIAITRWFDGW